MPFQATGSAALDIRWASFISRHEFRGRISVPPLAVRFPDT